MSTTIRPKAQWLRRITRKKTGRRLLFSMIAATAFFLLSPMQALSGEETAPNTASLSQSTAESDDDEPAPEDGVLPPLPSAETSFDDKSIPLLEDVVIRSVIPAPGITEVDRDRIERQKAQTSVDVLETLPSVYADTGLRGERIFSLRGFDQRQTVVLIDGLPAYIPADGQMDLSMLPAEMIDHVTVVEGPASILYGPNGLGGAVNFVTRQPGTGPLAQATLEKGTPQSISARALTSFRAGSAGFLFAGGETDSAAFELPESFTPTENETHSRERTNSDRRSSFAMGNTSMDLNAGNQLRTSLFYLDGAKGVPPSTIERTPKYWRFDPWRALGGSIGWERKDAGLLEADVALYGRYFENTLKSYDDRTYSTQERSDSFISTYRDTIAGIRARLGGRVIPLAGGDTHLRLWLQAQYDRHAQQPDEYEDWETHSRGLVTVAPEAEIRPARGLSFIAGMQTDIEAPLEAPSEYKGNTAIGWGPLTSVKWRPSERVTLAATGARRTRFPTLHERFAESGGRILRNPGLQPESAWHEQVTARFIPVSWLSIETAGWAAQVEDLIQLKNLGQGNRRMDNVNRARFEGANSTIGLMPWSWLDFRAGYAFLLAKSIDEAGVTRDLENKPAHKAVLELELVPFEGFRLSNFLEIVGERRYENPDTRQWSSLSPYERWGAVAEYDPVQGIDIWIKATNLLDTLYETQFGFPDPGRTLWAGVRVWLPKSEL